VAYCDVDDVKAKARLGEGDTLDDARIPDAIAAAALLIDAHLDRPATAAAFTADESSLLLLVNVGLALELLGRPLWGVIGGWGDVGPVRVAADPTYAWKYMLRPLKLTWGFA
jgi:hypothetical protein